MKRNEFPVNDDWRRDDWLVVLEDDQGATNPREFETVLTSAASANPFTTADVAEVVAWHGTSPEGWASLEFTCVLRLSDGRYAFCEAWADTSGWGCQDSTNWRLASTLVELVTHGMTPANASQLGLSEHRTAS